VTAGRRARKLVGMTPRTTPLILLVCAVTAVLGLSAVATGAIPSATGKIYGCFAKADGDLRVVDKAEGEKCGSGEKPLKWNQKGVAGAPGPAGPAGKAGPAGPAGAPGAPGLVGREVVTVLSPDNSDDFKTVAADCPPGKVVIGGGAAVANPDGGFTSLRQVQLYGSFPPFKTRWLGEAQELAPTAVTWALEVYAICAVA
jgi:hypothetical protein